MPPIYHFTDIENLPDILVAGELRCHRIAPTAVDVADTSIKSRRTRITVPCGPGGRVCDYVPFYYAPRSPMLYSIQCGNVPGVNPDQERLIYVVSSTEGAYRAGLRCVFTDGNAATAFTKFGDDPELLDEFVDWPVMRARLWYNTTEDPDRRRRRMAEFLVHEELPLALVTEIGAYGHDMQAQVAAMLDDAGIQLRIAIRRDWYF